MVKAITKALSGMESAMRLADSAAKRIAKAPPDDNLAGDIVDLRLASHSLKANAKVISIVREAEDGLPDLVA